jgi:hypothetical protein
MIHCQIQRQTSHRPVRDVREAFVQEDRGWLLDLMQLLCRPPVAAAEA